MTKIKHRDEQNNTFNRGNLQHNDRYGYYGNDSRARGQRRNFYLVGNQDNSKRFNEKKTKLEENDLGLDMLKRDLEIEQMKL